jgi:acetyl-CoA acetyltransferase
VKFVAKALPFRELNYCSSVTQGTVASTVAEAAYAISAGVCSYALVWRAMHNPGGRFNLVEAGALTGDAQYVAPYGVGVPAVAFALLFSRYLARFGLSHGDMTEFIVRNRQSAALNPDAVFFGRPVSADDYRQSPVITSPLSYLDCDMPVDGCGAILLARADLARDLRHPPAYIRHAVSAGLERRHRPIMTYESFAESARSLASALWQGSGCRPSDIQSVNVYDGFSFLTPLLLESLGFCRDGEAPSAIAGGAFAVNGRTYLNSSGGALGMGRLHGTPQVIEAVRQVQGLCGQRQVPDVGHALAQVGGALTGSGALVLSRDPR